MTKAEIISYVKNNLKKIDKTNKYHDIVLEKAITLAFNQGYGDVYDQDPRLLDNYTKTYGGSGTPIAITANGNTGIYESTIPEVYVPFKDKHSGIRHIATIARSNTKFFPVSKKEFELLPNTYTGELSENASNIRCYYVVRGSTIEYHIPTAIASAGVRIDMVIPFDKYASTDMVLIPFAKDMQLVSAVIEAMRTIPAVDLKDNNSDMQ